MTINKGEKGKNRINIFEKAVVSSEQEEKSLYLVDCWGIVQLMGLVLGATKVKAG